MGVLALSSTIVPSAFAQCDPADLFGQPLSFSAQAIAAINIVAADFNSDGILDVATESDSGSGFVSVLLGNGNGVFGPAISLVVNQGRPVGLSVGDVNGDGFPDMVTANSGSANVALLLGNGDGTFETFRVISVGNTSGAFDTALVDVTNDGFLDLLVSEPSQDRLWFLRGDGQGAFSAATTIPTGDNPFYFVVTDLDGDNVQDILVGNQGTPDDVSIIRGAGSGQFFAQVRLTFGGTEIMRPAVADLNGDGINDIVVAQSAVDNVAVRLGTGGLNFAPQVLYPMGDAPRHVKLVDVSNDGVLDMIVAGVNSNRISIRPGNGDGTFGDEVRYETNVRPEDAVIFDANGDGMNDVVVVNSTSQDITPLLNMCEPGLTIVAQPVNAIATPGARVQFSVQATSFDLISYQWYKDDTVLVDGPGISGSNSAVLTLDPIGIGGSGRYRALVVSGSDAALTEFASVGLMISCPADFDLSGTLNSSDFLEYLNFYTTGCPQ
ncbi:MAG: FG-GAP-like repeat-containing protein [Phycisphaerales bacterium]|jgi:hypothetical protein|nr:FG-GAP-like repeat-containing protein [Phycisphaerales bacterium]